MRRADVILIVAPQDDLHAMVVARRVHELCEEAVIPVVVDTATFPIASEVSWAVLADEWSARCSVADPLSAFISRRAGHVLRNRKSERCFVEGRRVRAVWLRRARPVIVDPDVVSGEVEDFCRASTTALLEACFLAFRRVCNRPEADYRAGNKPYQLLMARRAGLAVPETVVTSNASEAAAFIQRLGDDGRECIYKTVGIASAVTVPTRLVSESDLARLGTLRLSPVTFQERITGGPNVRVAIVGRQVFAARWTAGEDHDDPVDIRLDDRARMSPHQLDDAVISGLLRLHGALGLVFGVYDLKYSGDGRCYFLEVNPSGQWLDLELESDHPVSETWARVLADGVVAPMAQTLEILDEARLSELRPRQEPSHVEWVRHV